MSAARSRATAWCQALALVASASACGDGAAPPEAGPAPRAMELAGGVVARVGGEDIAGASVAGIAAAQKIDPAPARDLAIHDALLASEARAQGIDAAPDTAFALRTVLARRMLRGLVDDARNKGPATDEELRILTERRWLELDRPEGFQTIHAVVLVEGKDDEAKKKRAEAIAAAIREAVKPAAEAARSAPAPAAEPGAAPPPPDPAVEPFTKAANAVPAEGFKVQIDLLPGVTADGRFLVPEAATVDVDFARAAAALGRRGDLSPVVRSQFGAHVILLLERIPGHTVPIEERRRLVHDEVITARARGAQTRLLEELRRGATVDRSADALLALVPIEP